MDLFEKAFIKQPQFKHTTGLILSSDLWHLNLQDLDKIAKALKKELNSSDEESFITENKKSSDDTQLKFDLVLYVIKTRLAERDAVAKRKENKVKRERILAIMAQKDNEKLLSSSTEELEKLLAEIE